MRQQVQREEVFQMKLRAETVKRLHNRKSHALLIKTTDEDISNACNDGKMSC